MITVETKKIRKSAAIAAIIAGAAASPVAFGQDCPNFQANSPAANMEIKNSMRIFQNDECTPNTGMIDRGNYRRDSVILEAGAAQVKGDISRVTGGEFNELFSFSGVSNVLSISYEQSINDNIGIKETYTYDGVQKLGGDISFRGHELALNGTLKTEGIGVQVVFYKNFEYVRPFVEGGIFAYQTDAQATASYNSFSVGYKESGETGTPVIGIGLEVPGSSNVSLIVEYEKPFKAQGMKYELAPETLQVGVRIRF